MNALIAPKNDVKELLLNVAEKLFAEYGFDRTSIRMITGMAGINLSMINYYFGSKNELLKQIFLVRLQQIEIAFHDILHLEATVPDKLMKFLEVYTAVFSHNKFYTLLHREFAFLEVSPLKHLINDYLDNMLSIIKTLVDDGVKEGYVNSKDANLAYLSLLGLLPILVSDSPLNNVISINIDPGGQMFTVEKIKHYLYQILQNNQTEYIYRS